jgi:hypothetical protein
VATERGGQSDLEPGLENTRGSREQTHNSRGLGFPCASPNSKPNINTLISVGNSDLFRYSVFSGSSVELTKIFDDHGITSAAPAATSSTTNKISLASVQVSYLSTPRPTTFHL